jgi:hypothetical protein
MLKVTRSEQRPADAGESDVRLLDDEAVGEAQDDEARGLEEAVAIDVALPSRKVRRAVCFDDEVQVQANEVRVEGTEGLLASELGVLEATPSKQCPQGTLSGRLCAAQLALRESRGEAIAACRSVDASHASCVGTSAGSPFPSEGVGD